MYEESQNQDYLEKFGFRRGEDIDDIGRDLLEKELEWEDRDKLI